MIGRAVQDRAAERAIASRVSAAREPRAAAVPAAADVAADEAWAGAPPRPGPRKALVTTAIAQAASSVACAPRRIIGHGALLHALNPDPPIRWVVALKPAGGAAGAVV